MPQRTRSQRLNGLFPLSYVGVVPVSPVNFVIDNRPPTINDSKNFYIGDLWLDVDSHLPLPPEAENLWMLVSLNAGIATWINFAGGGQALETLSGDAGINPVFPDVNDNINVFGDNAAGLTVVGDGINTLTVTTTGGFRLGQFLTGDIGGAVPFDATGNINVITNVAIDNAGSSVLISGNPGTNTLTLNVTDAAENTLIGELAGNATLSGTRCTALGQNSMRAMTSAADDVVLGWHAGDAITTGSRNVAVGDDALGALTTGSDNIAVGSGAAVNYTGAESNNIIVGNPGTVADSAAIRVGTLGTQTTCFVQGIANVTVANELPVVIDSTTGQLGTTSAMTAFIADISATIPNVTGAGTIYQIVFDRTYINIGSDFNTGTGFYTAPADGLYNFSSTVTMSDLTNVMDTIVLSFIVAGTGPTVGAWSWMRGNPYAIRSTTIGIPELVRFNGSVMLQLDSGDTVGVIVQIFGGAGDTADVDTGAGGPPSRTWFTGNRIIQQFPSGLIRIFTHLNIYVTNIGQGRKNYFAFSVIGCFIEFMRWTVTYKRFG